MLNRRLRRSTLALLLLLTPVIVQAQSSTEGTIIPMPTVAEPDGATSVLHNSAGLATLRAWELRLYNTQMDDRAGEGTAFLFGMPVFGPLSLGAGLELLRPPGVDAYERLSIAAGFKLHHMIRLGLVWRHWFADDGAIDGTNSLDFGVLLRPASWLSAGLSLNDINTPVIDGVVHPREYAIGFGVQPGTDRVTIEAGLAIREDDADLDVIGRLRFEPWPGIEVIGHAKWFYPNCDGCDDQLEIGASLTFHFGRGGIEGGVFFRTLGDVPAIDGYTVGARLSGASYPSLVQRGNKTVLVEVGRLPETPAPGLLSRSFTFTHMVSYLDDLSRDDTVSGVLLRDKGTRFGWAQSEEIADRIAELKAAGKRVTVYLDQGELRHLFMYAGADRIVLNPAGGLVITGLKSTLTFYRDVLDKLHVETQWVRYGQYKSYPESFMRSGPSEPSLEVRNSLLDSLYGQIVAAVAKGRNVTPERVRELIHNGPYVAPECKERGLVDHLAFWDEVAEWMKEDQGAPVRIAKRGGRGYPAREPWGRDPLVAVIPIEGSIVEGKSTKNPILGTRTVGHETIVKAVQAAANNRRVVAIVLRVNSPGGSSVASDHMHRTILKAAQGKPVVASFGNVSASGGYYLAMGAREILASDATVTGSIGIFTGKPSFGRLFKLIGLGRVTLTRGDRADLFGTDAPWTEDQLRLLGEKLRFFYDLFLQRVADNREMTVEEVDALAQGRVWMGVQARERKLVDQRGGVLDAIRRAKELAGLARDADVALVFYPSASLIQRVRTTLGIEIEELLARIGDLHEALVIAYPFLNGFKPGEPLALMPFHITFD